MQIIEQDILTVKSGVIVQSCNCCGPMGGLAGAIKRKWPIVEEAYLALLASKPKKENFLFLGDYQLIEVKYDQLFVCNVFGQLNISSTERQTEYCALNEGLRKFKEWWHVISCDSINVYFPYLFGCGLGGGSWEIVSNIIDYHFPDAIICKLP